MNVADKELDLIKFDSKEKKKRKEIRIHRHTPGCAHPEGGPREDGANRGEPQMKPAPPAP